jgi:hypothetical protein
VSELRPRLRLQLKGRPLNGFGCLYLAHRSIILPGSPARPKAGVR